MKKSTLSRRWVCLAAVSAIAMATVAVGIATTNRRDAKITPKNFRRISVGMSRSELHTLLGRPTNQQIILGLVTDPKSLTTNSFGNPKELRQRGFADYVMDSWASPTISVTVIIDANNQVVCRYSSAGQTQTLLGRLLGHLRPQAEVTVATLPKPAPTDDE